MQSHIAGIGDVIQWRQASEASAPGGPGSGNPLRRRFGIVGGVPSQAAVMNSRGAASSPAPSSTVKPRRWGAVGGMPSQAAVFYVEGAAPEETTDELRGRRVRRSRTRLPVAEQVEQEALAPVQIDLRAPVTSLVPDANTLVVASASKAKRLSKTAEAKRRAAIELNDEQALERAVFDWF